MLIDRYDLEVFTPPCGPGTERLSAIARLVTDIGAVLPYLNATLPGAVYNAAAPALTWKKGGHTVVFHPYQIAVSNVEDRAAAIKEMEGLIRLVNRTWDRRAELKPDHEMHRRPGPMEVYRLLPQTNCRVCGQPTCYTFAIKLVLGKVELVDCPTIQEPECAGQWAQLQGLLPGGVPAIGRREP
jgi:ArsR family metal-binding transcriptional regulator